MMAGVSKIDAALFEQIQAGMNEGVGKRDVQRPIEMMLVELTDDIQSLSVGNEVSLGTDSQGVVLEFDGDFMFDYGSAKLREPVIPVLKKVAATLNTERYNSFNFEISGHTSDQPFSSPQYPSNWELSSARAAAVVRFLRAAGFPGSVCGPLACMMLRRSILTVIGMMCLFRKTGRKTAGWKSILCHHLSKFEKARFGGFFLLRQMAFAVENQEEAGYFPSAEIAISDLLRIFRSFRLGSGQKAGRKGISE